MDYYWELRINGRKGYESQPRVPEGDPRGGQWTSSGGGSGVAVRPEARPVRDKLLAKARVRIREVQDKDEWPDVLAEAHPVKPGDTPETHRAFWFRMSRYFGGEWLPDKDLILIGPGADDEIRLHEEAHAVFDRALTEGQRAAWWKLHPKFEPDEKFSELFAHGYAAYMQGAWSPSATPGEDDAYFDSLGKE